MLELVFVAVVFFMLGFGCHYLPRPKPGHEHVYARLRGGKAYCLHCEKWTRFMNG